MPIEVDFGTELGTVVFPEDYTQEQAFDFVKQNRKQIQQNLIQRRQQEMADETSQLEAAKYRAGEYGTLETIGGVVSELPKAITEGFGGAMKGAERLSGMVPARQFNPFTGQIGAQIQPSFQPGQGDLAKAGQAVQEFGRETFPTLPGVEESIPAQIAGGVGSTLSVLPGALLAGPVGAGALYGLSAGEAGAEDARRVINRRIAERLAAGDSQGAEDLQAQASQLESQSFLLNAAIGGVSEGALGVAGKIRFGKSNIGGVGARLAERMIPKAASLRTQNMIRGGVEGVVTEGLQESLEQSMGNMAAKVTYEPERGIMDGVAQAGFIGAATGGLVGGAIGSKRNPNLATANAIAEATGADPANPLPRSTATVSGLQDGPQSMGPIDIEPEITAEDVMRKSQEAGLAGQEEEVIPASQPQPKSKAAPVTPKIDIVRLDDLRKKANTGTINPDELAELTLMHQTMGIPDPVVAATPSTPTTTPTPAAATVDAETGLDSDEQDELDQLITAEDEGLLSEQGAITLAAYRARLGGVEPAAIQTQPTISSAIQEQGPSEGVLRAEEQQPPIEVGLRQVDQGGRPAESSGAEVQVTPQEVRQVKAAVVVAPVAPTPVQPKAPRKPRQESQVRQDAQEFDRLATDIAPDLGLIEDPALLSPVFSGNIQDKGSIAAKMARQKALATVKKRAIQQLGGNPEQNSEADRAALLTQMRELAAKVQQDRNIQAFDAAIQGGGPVAVNTSNLAVGDKMTVGGSELTITAVDPDTMDATADGGQRYGQINLPDGVELNIDAYTPAPAETPAAPAVRAPKLGAGQNQGDLIASTQAEPLALVGEEVVDLEARKRRQEEAARAAAEAKAAREKAQTTMDFAIDAIDKVSKGLSENSYSDPLFLTPLAKLALQIAKGLIQVGVAVDKAIRQAIAQARQQFPNDPTDDIQLADRLIRDAEYAAAVAAGDMDTAQRMVDEAAVASGAYSGIGKRLSDWARNDTDEATRQVRFTNPSTGEQATFGDVISDLQSISDEAAPEYVRWLQSIPNKSTATADIVSDITWISRLQPAVTRDEAGNPIALSQRFQPTTAAQPDRVEAILKKVIAATDPKGKVFEAVAGLSNFVIFQATKIALRIYQATKSWVAARNAGMDYIKSQVQLSNEAETAANFEEHIKAFPNQEIPTGTPERPQPPSPSERVESRGIFRGEVARDTDENWQAQARKWVDFYKGNLEQAFQGFMGADIDKALREYVGGELLQRSELEVARAKNPIDLLRALNLQARIAAALVQAGSDFGKQGRARQLTFARYAWMVPQLVYRRLVNEQQKRKIPFPEIVAQQVREWLVESGQQAIDQVKEAMKQADNVFAREFKKIKQVPGQPGGPPIEIKWRDILTKSLQTQGSVRQKMLQVILADPKLRNLSPAGIAEITNLLTTAWEKKRDQIFRSEFAKKIPLPTVKPDAREKLLRSLPRILKYANIARATPGDQITNDGPETFLLWDQAFRDAVAPEFGVAEINGLTARKLTELAQRAQKAQGVNRNEIIQEMFRMMARDGGVRFSDVLRDYWYAAVLSGTRTQLDNALNILNGALNTVMLAVMAGKEAGLVTKSALKGLDEGLRDFWPMLWRGELYRSVNFNPDQPSNALEGLGESRNLFAKGISQAKYVSRLMLALDHVTAMMSDGAAKAYALNKEVGPEEARNLMLPDKAEVQAARDRAIAEGTRPDLINKRTREILQESFPVDVLMTSKDIREAVTFTEVPQGLMGSLYEGLNAASRKFPALKFLTGTNFVRFAANYTNELLNYAAPIAVYRWIQSAPGKSDQPGGLQYSPARRDLLRAKAALGTALGATAAALFLGDDDKEEDRDIDITGSFKSLDPNKRKQLLAEGRQPYSIRVGDTYISYRQLGFGGLLGAIGELRDRQLFEPEKWNKESIIGKIQDAATAGLFIVKDSSAISGLTEFLGFANAYKYDTNEIVEKSAPRYLARLGGSFVPNILKEVDAWSDPSIFKAEPGGLGHEYFLQQVPYARREIGPGPILNVLGEPVRVERYPYSRWVTQRSEDPAWNTLGQLASKGVFMPTPAITVKVNENGTRRELTREEKYQYQQAVGQGYRKFIEQNRERLLALPPAQASDLIDKNADRIRRNARTNLKNSF